MSPNFKYLRNEFKDKGYCIIKNMLNKEEANQIINEILLAKNTISYLNKNNKTIRIEKFYDKGPALIDFNLKITDTFFSLFKKKFLIFKDKLNIKSSNTEGYDAHYDGIFHFYDENNNKKRGWYEYGDLFINALLSLDPCDEENGTIEIAKCHHGSFDEILKNTKNDGTPFLKKEIEKKISFKTIDLDIGDVVLFSNKCPHRSNKNNTDRNRRILYYTYSLAKNGSKYNDYYEDKKKSKNLHKALVDK